MKHVFIGIIFIGLFMSCSDTEEGLIGEWEGKTERVNSKGEVIDANISCIVNSGTGISRSILLKVAGGQYEFQAVEDVDVLIYKDRLIENDSTGRLYITGKAELLNDTLLHFDHKIYEMINNVLHNSNREVYDMVRK